MGLAGIPKPPRLARKVLPIVWPVGAAAVTGLATPVIVAGAFHSFIDKRARLFRVSVLGVGLVWVDVRMLMECWRLSLKNPTREGPQWEDDHEAVFLAGLNRAMILARQWVGFEVRLDGRMHFGSETAPLIAFARHAGPGDSLALAWLLGHTAGRMPKIVLAEALRWDPTVDALLTRMRSYFVPSRTGAGDDRVSGVRELARGLKEDDALLLFPEGQNFSPGRRRALISRLREAGQELRARRAISLWNTLPPKTRGVIAAMEARPDADVMIVAHAGFGQLTTPAEIWGAIPFTDRPFLVQTRTYAASDVPDEPAAIEAWIDDEWSDIDAWVTTVEGRAQGGADDRAQRAAEASPQSD
ncbi:1-acyl-sn-glycerol-3-phosphate acyltransferase [Knoellia subterranea]|uniref:Glycerol acyltransferase n=1 Tax=Knoellia subterranea KCTC 19937 TaxID=1385521 RepID=A0A0A0JK50_9MICO|nr:1-acyl-sn-glycerol-3-phosphate acyltransferase [Knoellia subterranea]KGN37134.1 glycerol acyltransferase [Knoellia subterranea KCTC 19937]